MADIIKALREATGSAGGYTVPDEFSNRLLALVQEKTVVVPDLDQMNMNTDVMYVPKTTQGSTAYWVPETNTISTSELAFGRTTLTAKKVAALVEASTEVLEDNNVSLANVLVDQMARDMALKVDDEIFNGTGGTFEGLRYTGSYSNSVSAGAAISLSNVNTAMTDVLSDNHNSPDVGYFHAKVIGQLRSLTDGSARPIFDEATWGSPILRDGGVGVVYGIKVKNANKLPINLSYGTGTAATCSDAIIGVQKQFGYYGQRRGIRMKRDYKITTDVEQYQATMRSAFAIKYADAYSVIRAIEVA